MLRRGGALPLPSAAYLVHAAAADVAELHARRDGGGQPLLLRTLEAHEVLVDGAGRVRIARECGAPAAPRPPSTTRPSRSRWAFWKR